MTEPTQAKTNQHINAFLKDYIALDHGPGYAVLIKGGWGVGKTEFIKKFVAETAQQNIYYMSLFGKTAVDEITQVAYEKKHPIQSKVNNMANVANENKDQVASTFASLSESVAGLDCLPETITDPAKKLTEKVASGFLSVFSKVTNMVADQAKDSLFDNTSILIFDDLERCLIDQQALFGWLHDKVELCRCKVILLADEQKILTKTNKELQKEFSYTEIKEKLIGVSFELQSCVDDAIMSFIAEIKKNKPKENNEELTKLFEHLNDLFMHCKDNLLFKNLCEATTNPIQVTKTNQPDKSAPDDTNTHNPFRNLRLIRMAMYGFARTYQNIDKKFHAESHRNHLEKVFKLYLCGYIEEQSGSRSKNHKSLNTFLGLVIDKYTQEYQGMNEFIEPMCDAILYEKIDAKTWNDALETFTTPPNEQPLWKRLSAYHELAQAEFNNLHQSLWQALEKKDTEVIKNYGTLMASALQLLEFDLNRLKKIDHQALINHVNTIVVELKIKTEASFHENVAESAGVIHFQSSFLDHLSSSPHKETFQTIKETINQAANASAEAHEAQKAAEFFEQLNKDPEQLTKMLQDQGYSNRDILHRWDHDQFIKLFKTTTNQNAWAIGILINYRYDVGGTNLSKEKTWLQTLSKKITPSLPSNNDQEITINQSHLKSLKKQIDDILETYPPT